MENAAQKRNDLYYCNKCDFKCSKKCDFNRHLITRKHAISPNNREIGKKVTPKVPLECIKCERQFKTYSGLWKHTHKFHKDDDNRDELDDDFKPHLDEKMVIMLIQENSDLKNMMIEQQKQQNIILEVIKNGTHNTSHINSHNKTFNLNFFLNETCKDAMNISDFVSSIRPKLDDLELTGRQGYVNGISNLIITHLNELETNQRPMHCSDLKREILYIKENNNWEKETAERPILTNAIKSIAFENIKNISEWKKANPNCSDSDSKYNNTYLNIVSNSMPGIDEEESDRNIDKIISNVAKKITITKTDIHHHS